MPKTYDLTKYEPVPMPSKAKIDKAARVLWNLASIEDLEGWEATFDARTLDFVGIWKGTADAMLDEIQVAIPVWDADVRKLGDAMDWLSVRCELEIRHAIERRNLANMHNRELLERLAEFDAEREASVEVAR